MTVLTAPPGRAYVVDFGPPMRTAREIELVPDPTFDLVAYVERKLRERAA